MTIRRGVGAAGPRGETVVRVKHLRPAGWLAVMTVFAFAVAACGSDDSSSGGAATTAAPATSATTAAPGSTSTAAGATTTAGSAASSAEWDAVVAKAKDEGKVTIYSSQGLDQLNDLAAKFKAKYGITAEVVRGIDSELVPKVEAEAKTGNRVADVF